MGKHAQKLEIRKEDWGTLERWSRSRTISADKHERAIMILESSAGTPVKDIAFRLNTYPNKVIEWGKRYEQEGLAGLRDRPRRGRPKIYGDLKVKVFEKKLYRLIKEDEKLAKQFDLINSIKSISPQTAMVMIVLTNGFTSFDKWRKFASYAGTAPFPNESGTFKGRPR